MLLSRINDVSRMWDGDLMTNIRYLSRSSDGTITFEFIEELEKGRKCFNEQQLKEYDDRSDEGYSFLFVPLLFVPVNSCSFHINHWVVHSPSIKGKEEISIQLVRLDGSKIDDSKESYIGAGHPILFMDTSGDSCSSSGYSSAYAVHAEGEDKEMSSYHHEEHSQNRKSYSSPKQLSDKSSNNNTFLPLSLPSLPLLLLFPSEEVYMSPLSAKVPKSLGQKVSKSIITMFELNFTQPFSTPIPMFPSISSENLFSSVEEDCCIIPSQGLSLLEFTVARFQSKYFLRVVGPSHEIEKLHADTCDESVLIGLNGIVMNLNLKYCSSWFLEESRGQRRVAVPNILKYYGDLHDIYIMPSHLSGSLFPSHFGSALVHSKIVNALIMYNIDGIATSREIRRVEKSGIVPFADKSFVSDISALPTPSREDIGKDKILDDDVYSDGSGFLYDDGGESLWLCLRNNSICGSIRVSHFKSVSTPDRTCHAPPMTDGKLFKIMKYHFRPLSSWNLGSFESIEYCFVNSNGITLKKGDHPFIFGSEKKITMIIELRQPQDGHCENMYLIPLHGDFNQDRSIHVRVFF
ncbi:hypothetical protein ADUPG1_011422 [Aduncisulcus paluster]|nr:hypothetical protein ADUPG1_011422 [Aduncisulcus paluster]